MQGMEIRVQYQLREGNQAADFLAKIGESGNNDFYHTLNELWH